MIGIHIVTAYTIEELQLQATQWLDYNQDISDVTLSSVSEITRDYRDVTLDIIKEEKVLTVLIKFETN